MSNLSWPSRLTLALVGILALCGSPSTLPQQGVDGDIPFEPQTNERWILIDTNTYILSVYTGKRLQAEFHNVAIGQHGSARTSREGDKTTPLGEFRIEYITDKTRYHRFLGLNYPTDKTALLAVQDGTISQSEYQTYIIQRRALGQAPQKTALGGSIGIHGVGKGNVHLHRIANWTDGCIALEDHQIEALSEMVEVGVRVFIR